MGRSGEHSSVLRQRKPHEHGRVTFVELFFDLVFVFAVTQLSHSLLKHFTPLGALETALLLMAVWWVWIYTSWVTNWLDPDKPAVRLMLFGLMLAGLLLSTSLPEAFEARGLLFAGAYVAMQLGRSLFMLWALKPHSPGNFRNFQRISIWLAVSGAVWLAGGLAEGETRLALWVVALAIEYAGPSQGFRVPGLGRSMTSDWDVEGGHLAERCALFVIIALGESILVTGATFAELAADPVTISAFLASFIGSVAMWWIYFNIGAERGSHHIASAEDPGRIARLGYTYIHLLLVAGIIVTAVADEFVLAHPTGHGEPGVTAVVIGGPALYLLGNMLFKRLSAPNLPLSHLVGLGLLALLVPAGFFTSPLLLSAATTVVLVAVGIWEGLSLRTPAASGTLSPP
ncbi:hypothetical protein D3874_14440 [Oleomonas cavernae]|uniref:Low temperature requirement protein A n=1 Tax=Oleomonas cavernae TaxID=2320859 RepID=A0A418WDK5_9PROT|nr:low temperature requirement protein A [Oleomonas cavernae]RJF88068.1 hypothetical protein D3874_14440 [Oleomonas cavernae]